MGNAAPLIGLALGIIICVVVVFGGLYFLVHVNNPQPSNITPTTMVTSSPLPTSNKVTYYLDQQFYSSRDLNSITLRFGGFIAASGGCTIVINRYQWDGGAAETRSFYITSTATNLYPAFTLENHTWKITDWNQVTLTITLEQLS
jgi:hypothetical protein